MNLETPSLKSRESRATTALAGIGLLAMVVVVALSLNPDNYFYYSTERLRPFEWDARHVVITSALVAVYTSVLVIAVLGTRLSPAWVRWGIASIVLGVWGAYASRFVVHMPIHWLAHLAYLWLAVVVAWVAFLACLVMTVWAVVSRRRGHA